MKVVIQRVSKASVSVSSEVVGSIGSGMLILVGFTHDDDATDLDWMVKKTLNLRIFEDDEAKMNLSLLDVEGAILVVSQFTLFASTRKGNRPSFIQAAKPAMANDLYERFVRKLEESGRPVQTGVFGAMMDIELNNDGPVTIIIDSKSRS